MIIPTYSPLKFPGGIPELLRLPLMQYAATTDDIGAFEANQ